MVDRFLLKVVVLAYLLFYADKIIPKIMGWARVTLTAFDAILRIMSNGHGVWY